MTPDIDLDALTALEQAATPAPWTADVAARGDCVLWGPNGQFVANAQSEPHWLPAADGGKRAVMFDVDRRDVALIAAVRNNLPALLSALTATRAKLERLKVQYAGVQMERDLANEQLRGWRKRAAAPQSVCICSTTRHDWSGQSVTETHPDASCPQHGDAAGAGDGEQDTPKPLITNGRPPRNPADDTHSLVGDGEQDTATTWRGMPVRTCDVEPSHLHHVYDDGQGKAMCPGKLVDLTADASVQGAADGEAQA